MRRLLATSVSLALALAWRSAGADEAAARRPIVLVVGADSPVNNITVEDARRIFAGNSVDLRPLNLPPGAEERVALDRILFGRGPDEIARFWLDRKIRGQGGPPRVIPSGRLAAKIVSHVPGTIGYLAEAALPPGTKAIRVNGLPHTHPRYPLFMRSRPR